MKVRDAVLMERSIMESSETGGIPSRCRSTWSTSQMSAYLGKGGFWMKQALTSLLMEGCWPSGTPATPLCWRPIADL